MPSSQFPDSEVFLQKLQSQLQAPLPGHAAQLMMAPQQRLPPEQWEEYIDRARLGAVLILFYPHRESIRTVFIQRPTYDGVHSGQVAFPGGGKEEADADIVTTALREANEEIGIESSDVRVLGALTQLYIPPSNFLITPVVGWAAERPHFQINEMEVVEIIEPSVDELLEKKAVNKKDIEVRGGVITNTPCFIIQERVVWGATAMMVSELNEILRKV